MIDYSSLSPDEAVKNLTLAFEVCCGGRKGGEEGGRKRGNEKKKEKKKEKEEKEK